MNATDEQLDRIIRVIGQCVSEWASTGRLCHLVYAYGHSMSLLSLISPNPTSPFFRSGRPPILDAAQWIQATLLVEIRALEIEKSLPDAPLFVQESMRDAEGNLPF